MDENSLSLRIYIVLCCFDDRLETAEISFTEKKAISIWEGFTDRDYKAYMENKEDAKSYDYSKTAGTKIIEFDISYDSFLKYSKKGKIIVDN